MNAEPSGGSAPPDQVGSRSLVPERRLSNRDFELVIRRAAELQAREAEGVGSEGISEAELIRIGAELGLSRQHLERALAETAFPEDAPGVLDRLYGSTMIRAARAVPGTPEEVGRQLERYLVEREYLAVQRRFPDRVRYTRAAGLAAAMGRATSQMLRRSPLLKVANLEVATRPFDEGMAFVSLATSLSNQRTAAAASSLAGGGTGAAVTGAVLGIAIAPPAALVAAPILALTYYWGKLYYQGVVRDIQTQLEAVLDRLEHGELPPPLRGWIPARGIG